MATYEHVVDSKGRLTLPAKERERLGSVVHLTRSHDDKCLYVFSDPDWQVFSEKLHAAPMKQSTLLERFFTPHDCEIDVQGRILLPQKFMDRYGITKNVVIHSYEKRLEVWDADRWNEFDDNIDIAQVDEFIEANDIRF